MAALLGGCASDDYIGDIPLNGGDVITMGMKEKKITRADKTGADAAADLGNNFVVAGYRQIGEDGGTGTTTDCIFDHYNVNYLKSSAKSTVSNTTGWEYVGQAVNTELSSAKEQTVKYWDTSADKYYFVAFSKGQGVTDESGNKTYATFGKVVEDKLGDVDVLDELDAETSAFTITGTVDQLNEAYFSDLVSVAKADFKTTTVTPRFRRVGAKLRIALYETIPGYSVTDVKFYTKDDDSAPDDTPKLYAASAIFPTGKGTVYVGYPNKYNSTENYYLKALTSFKSDSGDPTSSLSFSPLTYGALEKHEKVSDDVYLGRTTATASYSGKTAADAYINVTPSGSTSILPLTLKCDYTLVPVDGAGETIHVYGATALVPPAYTNWASNYAYTYIFKITDQTDGKAGKPDAGYAGLYPITFDAVEKTDVDDGYEETVSTLGSQAPTITTYQKGAAITENGENIYNPGTIYVTVYDDEVKELTVGTNISLFEITQVGGKKGDITETVVKACVEAANDITKTEYGPYSGYNTEYPENSVTLTRINDKLTAVDKIPSADSPFGTDIEVNGAKFTAEENKQYAIQYKNAEGKFTYKVLGVNDIKMYYYVNYTAHVEDIYDYKDYYWHDDTGIKHNMSGYAPKSYNVTYKNAQFLKDHLLYDESMDYSAAQTPNTNGIIEGRLIFDAPLTDISYAFFNIENLVSVNLPGTLTKIGDRAFEYCISLKEIVIPNEVTEIGVSAFEGCGKKTDFEEIKPSMSTGLERVMLNAKLEKIGNSAFENCINLSQINCPSSLASIGNNAFAGCKSLRTITFSNLEMLGEYAFWNCHNLNCVNLNEGLTNIPKYAFCICDINVPLSIPSTVTGIGEKAFEQNVNMPSLILPKYCGDIGEQAFGNCYGLKKVVIDNSLENDDLKSLNASVYKLAFEVSDQHVNDTKLEYVELPLNVKNIGDGAFNNCKKLETLILYSTNLVTLDDATSPGNKCNTFKYKINDVEYLNPNLKIYVPADLITSYENDSHWGLLNSQIKEINGGISIFHELSEAPAPPAD